MPEHSKFLLADSQIPTVWVNVLIMTLFFLAAIYY